MIRRRIALHPRKQCKVQLGAIPTDLPARDVKDREASVTRF